MVISPVRLGKYCIYHSCEHFHMSWVIIESNLFRHVGCIFRWEDTRRANSKWNVQIKFVEKWKYGVENNLIFTPCQKRGSCALSLEHTYVAPALRPLRDWQFSPIAEVTTRSPIGPGEVAVKLATRQGTSLRPNQSQPGFWTWVILRGSHMIETTLVRDLTSSSRRPVCLVTSTSRRPVWPKIYLMSCLKFTWIIHSTTT